MKNKSVIVFRWLGILPLALLAYVLIKILNDLGTSIFFSTEFVGGVVYSNGFSGHYILGPIYTFQRELIATASLFYVGLFVAPKFKKYVYFSMAGLYVLFLFVGAIGIGMMFGSNLWGGTENIMKSLIETSAQIIAIVIIGFGLFRGEIFENNSE